MRINKILAATVTSAMILTTTGCTVVDEIKAMIPGMEPEPESTQTPIHLSIILGTHANMEELDTAFLYEDIVETCASFGSVTVVVDDGNPYIAVNYDIPEETKKLTENNYRRVAEEHADKIIAQMQDTTALTEEVNTLEAVTLGARNLSAVADGEKKMIIMDSALQTTGAFTFCGNLIYKVDAAATIQKLKEKENLPDLSGVKIDLYGIGDTAEPQPNLSNQDRNALISFWKETFTASGAETITYHPQVVTTGTIAQNLPRVSIVTTSKEPIDIEVESTPIAEEAIDEKAQNTEEQLKDGAAFTLTEKNFFYKDSAVLLDTAAAKRAIQPFVAAMENNASLELLLLGMTATDGEAHSARLLSQDRAECIRKLFVEYNIDADRITCLGTGYDENPFHQDDLNEDGSLNQEIAPSNRTVIIMNRNCEEAQSLL